MHNNFPTDRTYSIISRQLTIKIVTMMDKTIISISMPKAFFGFYHKFTVTWKVMGALFNLLEKVNSISVSKLKKL